MWALVVQRDEVVDKLTKMLKMRGKSIQSDLLGVMSGWLDELGKLDTDRQCQDHTVATVEDFIRSSTIRNVSDLMEVDAENRAWWPEDELDSKQVQLGLFFARSVRGFCPAVVPLRFRPKVA